MMETAKIWIGLGLVLGAASGCYRDGAVCELDVEVPCVGPEGCVGAQSCGADGQLGECVCIDETTGGATTTSTSTSTTSTSDTGTLGAAQTATTAATTTGPAGDPTGTTTDESSSTGAAMTAGTTETCEEQTCEDLVDECGTLKACNGPDIECGCDPPYICEDGICAPPCEARKFLVYNGMPSDGVCDGASLMKVTDGKDSFTVMFGEWEEISVVYGDTKMLGIKCCQVYPEWCQFDGYCDSRPDLELKADSCGPTLKVGCEWP